MSKKNKDAARVCFALLVFWPPTSCVPRQAEAHQGSTASGSDAGGTILAISPETLPQGKMTAGVSIEYTRADRFSDAELISKASQHIHAHGVDYVFSTAVDVSYGVTDDTTFSLRLPHVYRENIRAGHHGHGGGGAVNTVEDHGDSFGRGDLTLLGKHRFLKDAKSGVDAAVLMGISVPLGKTGATSKEGERLDPEFQGGSGSWNPMAGFALSKKMDTLSIIGSALYTLSTEGVQDTTLGDRLSYNLSLTRAFNQWSAMLELNGEWAGRQEVSGISDDDTGGSEIFLSPGLAYTSESLWSAYVSVGVPLWSDTGAGETGTRLHVLTGIGRTF